MRLLSHGPDLTVTDPGANLGWWAQQEQGHAAKINIGEDADELDDDDEDDDDEDDDDDPDEGKDEATLKAELKQVRESLKKANGSSAKRRAREKELRKRLEERDDAKPKGKRRKDDDDDDDIDIDAIREAGKLEGRKEAEVLVKRTKIESALSRAGVADPKALKRLIGTIDLDDLDLDDDATFDEAVSDLKEDMPQLFSKRRKRESVAGSNDRNGDNDKPTKPKSASEKQAASLLGKG